MKKRCRRRNTGIHHDVVGKLQLLGFPWSCPGPAPESPSSALRGKKGQKIWLECKTYGWTVSEMWFDLKTQESKFRTSGTVDVLNGWGQVCLQPSHFRGYPSLTLENHTTSSAKHVAPFRAPFLAPNIINHPSGSNYNHNMWLFNIWQYLCICIYYNVHSYPITKSELFRNGSIQFFVPLVDGDPRPLTKNMGMSLMSYLKKMDNSSRIKSENPGKWSVVFKMSRPWYTTYESLWYHVASIAKSHQKVITHGCRWFPLRSFAWQTGWRPGDRIEIGTWDESIRKSSLLLKIQHDSARCLFSEPFNQHPSRFSRDSPIPPGNFWGMDVCRSVRLSVCMYVYVSVM